MKQDAGDYKFNVVGHFFYLLYYVNSLLQKQITIYYKSKVKQHYCIDDQRLNVRSDQRSLGFRVFLQQIGAVTFK